MKKYHKEISGFAEKVGIAFDSAVAVCEDGKPLSCDFEVNSHDFLHFAKEDLELGDMRGLVNGLSNAKRAIDSQVDRVLRSLGVGQGHFRKSRISKLNMLDNLGILAPRILNKARSARNLLEHEYRAPTHEQVEDAIDVAELFANVTDRIFEYFPTSADIANHSEPRGSFSWYKKCIDISTEWDEKGFLVATHSEEPCDGFNWENPRAHIELQEAAQKMREFREEYRVTPENRQYLSYVRLFVAIHRSKTGWISDPFQYLVDDG